MGQCLARIVAREGAPLKTIQLLLDLGDQLLQLGHSETPRVDRQLALGECQLDALAAPFGCRLTATVDLVSLAVDEPGRVVPYSVQGQDHVIGLADCCHLRAVHGALLAELIHVATPRTQAAPDGMQKAKGRCLGR
jgi:hypothetical protein